MSALFGLTDEQGNTCDRVLNIVDDVMRESLRAIVGTSISGRRVVRELAHVIGKRGKPKMIVSDNGIELTSNSVLA